ncbi:MAG: SET domain-containing protein-lysine N-methyltransferase [Anaerolineae bacterium]|nr:SET domain-containing protein-lysine N-methyltransferase [Anaerolineae bacterium]
MEPSRSPEPLRSTHAPKGAKKVCVLSDAIWRDFDPTPFLINFYWEMHYIHKATAVQQVRDLVQQNFDVFLNLCDGAWDEDRPGIEVVQALERFHVPFTGASTKFYEPSREMMKRVCHYYGLGTPGGMYARTPEDIDRAARTLRFPLIVKHPNSYNSIGLTKHSRVETVEHLQEQFQIMAESFGEALIEEFIDGREFTVLVVENPDNPYEPFAYNPVEFRFPAGETFKHYEMKMITYKQMEIIPCTDPVLAEKLMDMSKKVFVGLHGTSYGRCDIRVNAQGEPFLLEINPNCAVFYPEEFGSADMVLINDPGGHQGFLDRIIDAAIARNQRHARKWEVRFSRETGYGIFALETIEPGEMIDPLEEQAHYLVSKQHVMNVWNDTQREVFALYAYPITDDTWVMWSSDPNDWKPINHRCDPNAWLDGLNVVARQRILPGEEITLDYATFCNQDMREFVCICNAPNCREIVRGTDYLQPFIEQYGDHVSDYVRRKRAETVGMPQETA